MHDGPEPTQVYVGAAVEPELREQLLALAEQNDRSLAAEIRRALRLHVEREPAALEASA